MPAQRFTKKAKTPRLKRLWDHVYKGEKPKIGKVRAIRAANSSVARAVKKGRPYKRMI